MDLQITPSELRGRLDAPSSKSAAHRILIAAALSGGPCQISHLLSSDDILATISALDTLGAPMRLENDTLHILGRADLPHGPVVVDCRESGSTLRFLVPVCAALGLDVAFTGTGRLPQRPIEEYFRLFEGDTLHITRPQGQIMRLQGQLRPGTFEMRGDISSQYLTGLLMALPLLEGDSRIVLTTSLESKPYVDLTCAVLHDFGIEVEPFENGYILKGRQRYRAHDCMVEGDYSGAAFWLAAGAVAGPIEIHGLRRDTAQGDAQILPLLEQFGAQVTIHDGAVRVCQAPLHSIEIDAHDIPDLVPILAVVAAFAQGTTWIRRAQRLRLKESDRLASTYDVLCRMGADIEQMDDGFRIKGGRSLQGARIDCHGDHRIAMCAAIAATRAHGPTVLTGAQCVKKSYPGFFEDLRRLGGNVDVFMG